jgi:hypothetical protein
MTVAEVNVAIETTLAQVEFEPPVTVDYCARVRNVLRSMLPPDARIDVSFHRKDELVVEVRMGARMVAAVFPLV